MEALLAGPAIPLTYLAFFILERVVPGRPLPKVRFWAAKGIGFFLFMGVVMTFLPVLWTEAMRSHALADTSALPAVPVAIVAFVLSSGLSYATHRLMHRYNGLWRGFHQLHHAAERVDMAGMAINHPLDMAVLAFTSSLVPALLGVSPLAAALTGYLGLLAACIQHANIKTPRALGYFVQRPEMHAIHHERGVHAFNYADAPIWDILFGTFRNPASYSAAQYGFYDGASHETVAMLAFKDVSGAIAPTTAPRPLAA